MEQVESNALVPALPTLLPRTIAGHVQISAHAPAGAQNRRAQRILEARQQQGRQEGRLVLNVVGVRALRAVELVGGEIRARRGRVRGGVGDAGRLAVFACVEAVDDVQDEGRGCGEQDVAEVGSSVSGCALSLGWGELARSWDRGLWKP